MIIPKYRAFIKRYKEMYPVSVLDIRAERVLLHKELPDENHITYVEDLKDVELMEVTSLEDKTKEDIYFDDIINFSFHDKNDQSQNYKGCAVVIKSMNGGAGILFDWYDREGGLARPVLEGGQIEDLWDDEDLWTIEVIGNIYENPELLENKNEDK